MLYKSNNPGYNKPPNLSVLDSRIFALINQVIPAQTGNTGKLLATNGSQLFWISGPSGFTCTDLLSCSTTNLPEGTNLYFTNSRAVTALTGQNVSIFTNDAGYLTGASLVPYLTSATAAATYYTLANPAGYITSAALAPYLTSATAAATYQPIGSYLTTISGLNISLLTNDSGYITSSALSPYLTSATAAATYQPIGTYATASNSMTFTNKSGNISQWTNDSGYLTSTGITPAALTKVDDTNVTLTLGGTPNTALLQAVSLTLGWTGTLADSRIASAATWNAKQNALGYTPEDVFI